jgi:hypothetical protein
MTMTKSFAENLRVSVTKHAKPVMGGYALGGQEALMLAKRPPATPVTFGGFSDTGMLDGSLVAVDSVEAGGIRAWCDVHREGDPERAVLEALDRATALAVAQNDGVGLSLLAGCLDVQAFADRAEFLASRLGDLSMEAAPHWAMWLAAAKVRDSAFGYQIVSAPAGDDDPAPPVVEEPPRPQGVDLWVTLRVGTEATSMLVHEPLRVLSLELWWKAVQHALCRGIRDWAKALTVPQAS